MFRSRFTHRKNTFCSYRRNSPCVGLGDAVEANKRIVHLGAFPTHRMLMTACPTILWDGQKLHKNRIVRVRINLWRLRTVSSQVQKEYLKKCGLIYYSDQAQPKNKSLKKKINCRLDYWSGHFLEYHDWTIVFTWRPLTVRQEMFSWGIATCVLRHLLCNAETSTRRVASPPPPPVFRYGVDRRWH